MDRVELEPVATTAGAGFEVFFANSEPRLRAALVARHGRSWAVTPRLWR